MVSLAILSISSMGGVAAFMTLNRYAANLRKPQRGPGALQERIDQAQTMGFRPTASMVPLAADADPTTATSKYPAGMPILGASWLRPPYDAAVYNTTTGAFTGGANYVTSTENIPVYTQSDGTSANGSANVMLHARDDGLPDDVRSPTLAKLSSLNIVQFTVTVSYVFHGTTLFHVHDHSSWPGLTIPARDLPPSRPLPCAMKTRRHPSRLYHHRIARGHASISHGSGPDRLWRRFRGGGGLRAQYLHQSVLLECAPNPGPHRQRPAIRRQHAAFRSARPARTSLPSRRPAFRSRASAFGGTVPPRVSRSPRPR